MKQTRLEEIRDLLTPPGYDWGATEDAAIELLAEVDRLRTQVANLESQLAEADEEVLRLEQGDS